MIVTKIKNCMLNVFLCAGLFGFVIGLSLLGGADTKVVAIIGLPLAVVLWWVFISLEVFSKRREARELDAVEAKYHNLIEQNNVHSQQPIFDQDDYPFIDYYHSNQSKGNDGI